MLDWERSADARMVSTAALNATGLWVARLSPWRYFITLTHRPRAQVTSSQPVTSRGHRSGFAAYTRVGLSRHNASVRDWFYDEVRARAPGARLWGETELHAKGDPHEHAVLDVDADAPVYSMLDAWHEREGIWNCQRFSEDPDELVRAACYIEKAIKYAGKLTTQPPKIFGFGLLAAPSFSRVLA
jgi:hypothetical protein